MMLRCVATIVLCGFIQTGFADAPKDGRPKKLTYNLDRGHSNVAFRIKHFNVGFVCGLFRVESGKFHLDPENLGASFVEASVRASTLNTNHEKRDKHLKSADYFDIEKFKNITFKSQKVKFVGNDQFAIDGKLTFLGVTVPMTVDVKDMGATWMEHASAYQRGMTTTFTIDRTKFGMASEHYLGDEVEVFVSLEGGASNPEK